MNADPRSQVTRQDRAIYDAPWITGLLQRGQTCAVATAVDGQPFLSTLLYVYDPDRRAVWLHHARRGRLWDNLHANPRVCLTVSEMGRLLPAKTALNFSVEYSSVVVFGQAVLVDEPVEAERALQLLLDKYFPEHKPGVDYRPITPGELEATAVFRVDVETWSGKQKKV